MEYDFLWVESKFVALGTRPKRRGLKQTKNTGRSIFMEDFSFYGRRLDKWWPLCAFRHSGAPMAHDLKCEDWKWELGAWTSGQVAETNSEALWPKGHALTIALLFSYHNSVNSLDPISMRLCLGFVLGIEKRFHVCVGKNQIYCTWVLVN